MEAELDRNRGIIAIQKIKEAYESVNVKWSLISGSVLAVHRDGSLNEWDKDIDTGYIEGDRNAIIEAFKRVGFVFWSEFGSEEIGLQLQFRYDGLNVDVHKHYTGNGKIWHSAWDGDKLDWQQAEEVRYYFTPFKIKQVLFEGVQVFVPADTPLYLSEHYGDWWNRREEWHWAKSAPNHKYTGIIMPVKYWGI